MASLACVRAKRALLCSDYMHTRPSGSEYPGNSHSPSEISNDDITLLDSIKS